MARIDLGYGSTKVAFEVDEDRFEVIALAEQQGPLADIEIGERLDAPIGTQPLEDLIGQNETVLFVVPDATRQAGAGQIINLLVRRLIASGVEPHRMAAIFATGIHRKVTEDEKRSILTPFIAQRLKTLDHDPRDLMRLVRVGETSGGIPLELNRALTEFDRVVLIGGVTFHYFAGFTGGRKLVCPGLAASKTISATHKLAFDCERMDRREGVGTAMLDGNAVHEAFMEAASKAKIAFSVNTIVNDAGDVTDVFCGDWIESHRAACDVFAKGHTVSIPEKRDLVVASCGGYPFDINMIQAHKSLEAASHACADGGTIILLAECRDGLGRDDFLNWFTAADSDELAARLCEKYQVNGQTAWSLLKKAERFNVKMMSTMDGGTLKLLRSEKLDTEDVQRLINETTRGYVIPNASKLLIKT
jgi:nickel-dependent lactate racemase